MIKGNDEILRLTYLRIVFFICIDLLIEKCLIENKTLLF